MVNGRHDMGTSIMNVSPMAISDVGSNDDISFTKYTLEHIIRNACKVPLVVDDGRHSCMV